MSRAQGYKHHSYSVGHLYGLSDSLKGEIGLEVETIGKNLPSVGGLWKHEPDHSIKPRPGEAGLEYVLRQPIGRPKLEAALDQLHTALTATGVEVAEGRLSNSVHTHINARDLTMQQVYTWLATYFIFEDILTRWAGEDRVGNLFCLRAKDARNLITRLAQAAREDNFQYFSSHNHKTFKYAAANVGTLGKYGSLEFRALRGTIRKDVIKPWVETLLAIKDKSLQYKDPTEVLKDFSWRSPLGFTRHVIPAPIRDFAFQQPDFVEALYEGARLSQDFAFSTEWQSKPFKPEPPKPKAASADFDELTTVDVEAAPPQPTATQAVNPWFTGPLSTSSGTITTASTAPPPAPTPYPQQLAAHWTSKRYWVYNASNGYCGKADSTIPAANRRYVKLSQSIITYVTANSNRSIGWKNMHGVPTLCVINLQTGNAMYYVGQTEVTDVHPAT